MIIDSFLQADKRVVLLGHKRVATKSGSTKKHRAGQSGQNRLVIAEGMVVAGQVPVRLSWQELLQRTNLSPDVLAQEDTVIVPPHLLAGDDKHLPLAESDFFFLRVTPMVCKQACHFLPLLFCFSQSAYF